MPSHEPSFAALEFANPPMLGWLAAAALPWLINLWNRRRRQRTPWAAVDLLLTAVRRSARQLRLEQWLLLALRTALLVLVALAAAAPVLRDASFSPRASVRTHHVLVLDCSLSMAVETDGATRLQRAQEAARRQILGAPAGDCFSVIAWADAADAVAQQVTFQASDAMAAVDRVRPRDETAQLARAVEAAAAAIVRGQRRATGPLAPNVAFFTDMTAVTWDPEEWNLPEAADPFTAIDRRLAAAAPSQTYPVAFHVFNSDEGYRDNVAVNALRFASPPPVVGRSNALIVHVRNFGSSTREIPLEVSLDDLPIAQRSMSVGPGSVATENIPVTLSTLGPHTVEVLMAGEVDRLPADNRRSLSFDARRSIRVACFFGRPGAADDLARALNPRNDPDGIAVERFPIGRLDAVELSQYEAVMLCNAGAPTAREAKLLERYTARGGALIIWLGDRVDPGQYNRQLGPLLPGKLDEEVAPEQCRFDPLGYAHPVVAPFAGRQRSGLLQVHVAKYVRVVPRESGQQLPTVLAYANGDPALLVDRYKSGSIALATTNPALRTDGDPWSSLAVSPSFLPLIRELFGYLTALPTEASSPADAARESDLAAAPELTIPDAEAVPAAARTAVVALQQPLLAAALVVLLAELACAWQLGRGRA